MPTAPNSSSYPSLPFSVDRVSRRHHLTPVMTRRRDLSGDASQRLLCLQVRGAKEGRCGRGSHGACVCAMLGSFPPLTSPAFSRAAGRERRCSVRIAAFSVAARAGAARASGLKHIQRPCGTRLQKLQRLVHSPPLPQPLSTPAGAERGANSPMWPTLCLGWRSRATANVQTRREPRECGTPLMLPAFTLRIGRAP